MSNRVAVGRDECGDETTVDMEPGQTLDDIRAMYPEYRFTNTETKRDKAYYQERYADLDVHNQQW